ncbi:DUF4233 domain-containing protein [Corynebacterium sphenisci]|uniref:DUF4233 domain-containing protein n=1 Tax=Corynebacterium sphenisci TaxID=191493 RepID=UPI0026E04868|nr:DUF4233 domain-containing protein [Corynebacterium sphenisci]MDO5730313.1 DUF4233 domain-containing protein [Corynebacterium sphenisci]
MTTPEDPRAPRETGAERAEAIEYGPLGPGHAPEKDPLAGLRGVMAGTLVMQAISVLLGLTVLARVDEGAHATPVAMGSVTALGVAMVAMAFLQRRPWAMRANLALQVPAILTFFAHWSLGLVGVLFALVWAYILHLRGNLLERMRRGLLTTQHT